MFTLKIKSNEPNELDTVIKTLLIQMDDTSPTTPEFATMADQLTKLYKLKETDSPKRVSPDTLVNAAASLGGILLIIAYEQKHIMLSKALSFVTKSR